MAMSMAPGPRYGNGEHVALLETEINGAAGDQGTRVHGS